MSLVPLACFTAHLSEVGPAAELELQDERAVGHLVHILALFRVVCRSRFTLGLALLHAGRLQGLHAVAGRLPSMSQALDGSSLLAKATLCRALSPLASDPARRWAAPQVAPHAGRGLGAFVALGWGQSCAVVTTLAEDNAVAETWPTAWGALRPVQGNPLWRARLVIARLKHLWPWMGARGIIQGLLLSGRDLTLAEDAACADAFVATSAAFRPVPNHPGWGARFHIAWPLPLRHFGFRATEMVGYS